MSIKRKFAHLKSQTDLIEPVGPMLKYLLSILLIFVLEKIWLLGKQLYKHELTNSQ